MDHHNHPYNMSVKVFRPVGQINAATAAKLSTPHADEHHVGRILLCRRRAGEWGKVPGGEVA